MATADALRARTRASSLAPLSELLPFVQFDCAGRLGPDDGRYLVRDAHGKAEHVIVVGGLTGLASGITRGRRRKAKPRRSSGREVPEVPVTRVTVIRSEHFSSADEASEWLVATTGSENRRDELVAEALRIVNRALHLHGVAVQNAEQGGITTNDPLTTRIGFGSGDELADGRWTEAFEVPPEAGRLSRSQALRPQERLAAALGGRDRHDACETLVLRARSDVDAGRTREAALQLRVALEALLAEVRPDGAEPFGGELAQGQAEAQLADLAELEARRPAAGQAANEALAGELTDARAGEVTETVRLCERVLRRRRLLRA